MDSKRRFSYQWRLFVPTVAFLWIIIGCFGYFRYTSEKEIRESQLREDLRLINARAIDAYENNMQLEPYLKFLKQYCDGSELMDVRMSIYDDKGNLLYFIGTPIASVIDDEDTPERRMAIEGDEGYGTSIRKGSSADEYFFFSVSRSNDGKIFVHTAMPYTDAVIRSISVDKRFWFVIVPIALIATLIVYISTRYLGKNVKLLRDFSAKVANDEKFDLDEDFPHDELGDVSRRIVELYKSRQEANERSDREHRLALKINEEKMRLTKQLTNNINHELKTPVGVLKGYLDTIIDHPDMDSGARTRFLMKAREHMDRLCNMLNDLSSITRLEEDGAGIMREKVDFSELVHSLAQELKSINLNNGVQFVYDLPDHCIVFGNYNLLYAMILNLVRNADFHSKGTECGIKYLSENNREYRFSFYDNGTGVGEEHLPHLFERFYRIDKGCSRKVGGTGLGLPIVKNTINVMGGTINVKNRAEGGLEFTFTLPKWVENAAKA